VWLSGNLGIQYFSDATAPLTVRPVSLGTGGLGFSFSDYFAYFEVENDGATLTFRASQEGVLYLDLYSEALSDHIESVDKVGFGQNLQFTPSTLQQATALWQWTD
jgi:hypothetical protein